jgi:tRNA threonylcarbamoyladenosine biosynthesis protein TsaB
MKGIIIDTSGSRSYLLLADAGIPLMFLPMAEGHDLSKNLGSCIKTVLNKYSSFKAEFVAVGIGPGSYTGIRVGTAMAKALAYGWQVPLVDFCSLKAFAPPSVQGPFAILRDARGGGVYCLNGSRIDGLFSFETPCLVASISQITDGRKLLSPDAECVRAKYPGISISESDPNIHFLSSECCRWASRKDCDPLSPLSFHWLR